MFIPLLDKFPVDALIIQKRGHGISAMHDKARYMGRGADTYYEFKKLNIKTLPCSYDQMIIQSSGKPFGIFYEYERNMVIPLDMNNLGRTKQELKVKTPKMEMVPKLKKDGTPETKKGPVLYKNGRMKLGKDKKPIIEEHPVMVKATVKDNDGNIVMVEETKTVEVAEILKIIDPGVAFWGQQRRRKAEERHKEESWWDKNQMFIMHAMTWILMIVLTYIFMSSIGDASFNVIDVINQYAGVETPATPPG